MRYTLFALVTLATITELQSSRVNVTIRTDTAAGVVEPEFLSLTLDSYLMQDDVRWGKFNFRSQKVQTLMSALSPGYIRVGGTPADSLFFDVPHTKFDAAKMHPSPVFMTKTDWNNLVSLTRDCNMRLLFDLSLQLRFGEQWNPSNAIALLEYSVAQGFGENIDFELGNEPGLFASPGQEGQTHLTGKQVGKDVKEFRRIINQFTQFNSSRIVGPDVLVSPRILKSYYFQGPGATWKDYINASHFSNLTGIIQMAQTIISSTPFPHVPLWLGETSDSWDSGTPNVSDKFVSGFLWLDKLGTAAVHNVSVVMRQDFYGHHYGLLDEQLNPNPDYWLSYLHKQLTGLMVLYVNVDKVHRGLRIYAHCTRTQAGYPPGAITLFFLNVEQKKTFHVFLTGLMGRGEADLYLLQAPNQNMLSSVVLLNGEPLHMTTDETMPPMKPRAIQMEDGVSIPPLSMGFLVLIVANKSICYRAYVTSK